MLRKLELLVPSMIAGTLVLGFSAPAFADVPPVEPREDPPAPQPEPAPEQPESKTETDAKPEAKADAKPDAKKAEDKTSGNCSIDDSDDRNILGLAALVLVISGAALRRRRR